MDPQWPPREAAQAIIDLPSLQQAAHERVAGVTWMVWGLAFAASMTMDTMPGGWEGTAWSRWTMALLGALLPLAAAAVLTGALWTSQAVVPSSRVRPAWSLAFLALLAPLAGLVVVVLFTLVGVLVAGPLVPGDTTTFQAGPAVPLVGAGIWAAFFSRTGWSPGVRSRAWGWLSFAALVVAGLVVALLSQAGPWPTVPFAQAAPVLVVFMAAGLDLVRRG